MLLVDSLMPNILEDAIRHKTVPALQFLKDRGRYWPNCVTVFPTMTASVDSSLLTGEYPDVHRVPGLYGMIRKRRRSSITSTDGNASTSWGCPTVPAMFFLT